MAGNGPRQPQRWGDHLAAAAPRSASAGAALARPNHAPRLLPSPLSPPTRHVAQPSDGHRAGGAQVDGKVAVLRVTIVPPHKLPRRKHARQLLRGRQRGLQLGWAGQSSPPVATTCHSRPCRRAGAAVPCVLACGSSMQPEHRRSAPPPGAHLAGAPQLAVALGAIAQHHGVVVAAQLVQGQVAAHLGTRRGRRR